MRKLQGKVSLFQSFEFLFKKMSIRSISTPSLFQTNKQQNRIRKKARYEELVACEKKYRDLLQKQDFQKARRGTIVNFMSARSHLLKPKPSNYNNNDNNSWNFSFEQDTSSCKSEDAVVMSSNNIDLSLTAVYKDHVMDCASFTVDVISSLTQLTAANLTNFQAYDNQIVNQIRSKVGADYNLTFEYKIKGSIDGVALSDNDDGFAECEFSVSSSEAKEEKQQQQQQQHNFRVNLKSDFLYVKFAKKSTKILCMKIFNVSDEVDSFSITKLHNAGFGNFPSVVSLEQTTCSVTSEKTL